MLNYEFKRTSRTCCVSGRVFQRGEEFISALIENDRGETVRQDFAIEAWNQPPEDCIGWWKTRLPVIGKGNVYWAPKDVLLSYFHHLQEIDEQTDLRYVMSLLLVRKRILKLVETVEVDGIEVMHLKNLSDDSKYEVPVIQLSSQRVTEIQEELSEKLFTDSAATDLGDEIIP